MTSTEIRKAFLDFFESKGHKIVPSAPIVVKNDPTLLFINSGMAPFKEYFLGNGMPPSKRIADTQKCLRVSGKHNDLEEVGVDTYHHTMFEMLGNWSFGDYFKKEAIEWAWELLTSVYKLDKTRLYVTVFEGDAKENLPFDQEAYDEWKKWIDEERILRGNKKDNFWEMGDTGPCGPCSEIHIDLRSDEERHQIPGADLVNNDHPQVIEIWNNVFMQFERKADKSLVSLPDKHVDTGMGFERLVRAIHGKTSNYDTDIFMPTIEFISKKSGIEYHFTESTNASICGNCVKQDIAMRVIADHIRTISFTIADGQLPSNTGAGYVIRRILRRAVRYGYSALHFETPFLHELVGLVANQFASVFPELKAQEAFVAKVILEEETSFLRTLSQGIKRFEAIEKEMNGSTIVPGKVAFELFDTYGFPLDLTKLLAAEKGFTVDEVEFETELQIQKNRSRKAAETEQSDWVQVADDVKTEFLGYDSFEVKSHLVKYRKTKVKDTDIYQLVLDKTPFYAESGGQIGDSGYLDFAGEKVDVFDTKKENDLIIHFAKKLPAKTDAAVDAKINLQKRTDTTRNHSATHLLQAALREVLGTHVQQKGSLVTPDTLRFDFSHFAKVTDEEIAKVEQIVNEKIMQNIVLDERRNVAIADAEKLGATMLFGEKYGDFVRVITFDEHFSRELCGGCHVPATGVIGLFKITSEGSVAAGVRRIEAVTGRKALQLANDAISELANVKVALNNSKNILKSIDDLVNENKALKKEAEEIAAKQVVELKNQLLQKIQVVNGVNVIAELVEIGNNDALKNLVYMLKNEVKNFVLVLGASINGKANVHIMIEEELSKAKGLSAGAWIKELSPIIKGGGGGQPFYASAGGTNVDGLTQFLNAVKEKI
jgi:alanyl-tRNA synthetase